MEEQKWTKVIEPKNHLLELNLVELIQYRDLIAMFIKRNFMTLYKQTILGPLWLIITPIINTIISTFVFGTIAKIPSDGVPYFLFYMAGSTIWTYFANCINNTANTFVNNAGVFGKVYFPRLTVPIATVVSGIINLLVQTSLFVGFMIYFAMNGAELHPNAWLLFTPVLIIQVAMLGLGCGIIVSSLTTKYRDLTVLVSFGVSLWMYITPIIYSISSLPEQWKKLCMINPMAPVVEMFRFAFLGVGTPDLFFWLISFAETLIIMFCGVVLFNRVEKTFMDTV